MTQATARIAYSIPEAAEAVGVGRTSLQRAIDAGDLVLHYTSAAPTKPLILADDLRAWIESAPTERSA